MSTGGSGKNGKNKNGTMPLGAWVSPSAVDGSSPDASRSVVGAGGGAAYVTLVVGAYS
jgi:hypothetical protein